MDSVQYCLKHLKENDKQAYLTTLLMPPSYQKDLVVLYAFQAEITRIRYMVREAIAGEIRLQWWRDALTENQGEAKANPLAKALLTTIESCDLPRENFDKILLARAFDLYNDPLPLWSDFETYAGETRSLFLQLTCFAAGASPTKELADACGYAGIVLTIQQILQNIAHDASREQIFISDDILHHFGADKQRIFDGEMHKEFQAVLNEMASRGRNYYEKMISSLNFVSKESALLLKMPLCLALPTFKLVEKQGFSPYDKPVKLSQVYQQWCLMKARYF